MDIKQTVDLTYDKVDEIDKKINRVMSTTQSSSSNTNIQTTLTELDTKVDTINSNMSNFSADINTISNQTTNLSTMNNNITTINSNTATTNNNVNTIKSDVTNIKSILPSVNHNNQVIQKLNEILKVLKKNYSEIDFVPDPYKLNQQYTERIENHRNPSNYACFELSEFDCKYYILHAIAHCESETFSYNFTITFTLEKRTPVCFSSNFESTSTIWYDIGTHTVTKNGTDISIVNNKIVFCYFNTYGGFRVNHLKLELFGNNVKIVPERRKFRITYALDKMIISKTQNNNGYYLIINEKNAITPNMLNEEYILDVNNVYDYEKNIGTSKIRGKNYCVVFANIFSTLGLKLSYNFNDELKYEKAGDFYYTDFSTGYCDYNYFYHSRIQFEKSNFKSKIILSKLGLSSLGENNSNLTYQNEDAVGVTMVQDLNGFCSDNKIAFVITDIKGINFFYKPSMTTALNIGYGKNITAYFDNNNPLLIHIYMNDGGYCVKKNILVSNDGTTATILSQNIIGTYDTYFETPSEVYIIEKNDNLYAFNNTLTLNNGSLNESEEN